MTKCRVCAAPIIKFFSLGRMPLVNAFLEKKDIPKEKKFDLSIGFCPNCYLVQLIKTVDPKDLFRNYLYFSSVTQTILQHSKKTSEDFIKRFKLSSNTLVFEIGSNDGVHLQFYKNKGIPVLGIDPAKNIAKVANKKGIPTLAEFFNLKLAKKLVGRKKIKADIVYGANVFAHVPQIVDFVKGVKEILKENGTAIFEFPYVRGLFENKFDTIYHEHVFYYSFIALENLFSKVSLEIYDVEHISMQGGSLRIFISHKGQFPLSQTVTNLSKKEKQDGFANIDTYRKIDKNIQAVKKELISLLQKLKAEKKTIAGYAVPAKGVILLHYFGIKKYLNFIVDKSPAKQGLYVPGVHMVINNPSKIQNDTPDYLLILAWNIKGEVLSQYQWYKNKGGKFIIPIPKIQTI